MSTVAAVPDVDALAELLDDARLTATPIAQPSARTPIGLDAAYAVQDALIARRIGRGERLVGVEARLHQPGEGAQMGVDEVILGTAHRRDAGRRRRSRSTWRRASTRASSRRSRSCWAPTSARMAARDPSSHRRASHPRSRSSTRGTRLPVHLADVVADNTSAAAYAIGPWRADGRCRPDRAIAACCSRSTAGSCRPARPPRSSATRAAPSPPPAAWRGGTGSRCGPAPCCWPARRPPPCRCHRSGTVEATITGLGRVSIRIDGREGR